MYAIIKSFAKLNLTLRVTGVRGDGYHDICSLFYRVDASESLRVTASDKDCDTVSAEGAVIKGENIIARALRLAREHGAEVPFLNVSVRKTIPPGMGLGGGSGNAGAILGFVGAELPLSVVSKIGADVPFFYENHSAAIVSGTGDRISPLGADALPFSAVLVIPNWNSITGGAYKLLDAYWSARGGYPKGEDEAREELEGIYALLTSGKTVGLLPNDFAPMLISENNLYEKFFEIFRSSGAAAWGITGSGASMFALYPDGKIPLSLLDNLQICTDFTDRIIFQ